MSGMERSEEVVDWSHVEALAEVTAERDAARATAVRLEQELARAEERVGYYIVSTTGDPQTWDGEVHATREDAEESLAQISEHPDWHPSERPEFWEVVGLVRLEPRS